MIGAGETGGLTIALAAEVNPFIAGPKVGEIAFIAELLIVSRKLLKAI